ncbi:multiubiquitin domain-containing protein (plasmid) [Rhizobium sp. T1470]|uniref:multiubiquitin domain-containing protein n=1 Tax=unclassified Rhizobium TaxID=2613769 RepID=UPI001AAFF435|nr:multiubiquitin domain-containing protein [Rhizobium sp. T1473]MCA0807381.1 multiubiquitin domain-containing protein [Rhizobium sp. T1473]
MSAELTIAKTKGLFIEVAGTDLAFRPVSVADRSPTGRQILGYCDVAPRDEYVVLQWMPEGDIEEVRSDELVSLDSDVAAKFIVAKADRLYRLFLNDRSLSWPDRSISEAALRILGKIPETELLYVRREAEPDRPIEVGGSLSLAEVGVESVYSRHAEWELNVQGVTIKFDRPDVVVRDALTKAGFNPDQGWIIVLKARDGKRQVTVDDTIDLRSPGIEKLRLTPREINNGELPQSRRQFRLLPVDEAGLTARGFHWETIVDGARRWLLLHGMELPAGYTVASTSVAIEVPSSYPTAELDMFYCYPQLNRQDGVAIPQTQVTEAIEGRGFQRWSRHRGAIAPWRPGLDNVITHLALVEAALLREVEV